MQNLELKVRCVNADMLIELEDLAIRGGAKYVETIYQRDTYFTVPRGRLKLREWQVEDSAINQSDTREPASGATLIGYARPDEQGTRLSNYVLTRIPEPETLIGALKPTLGIKIVVEKTRRLVMYGSTRLHFDQVANLGPFIELETVMSESLPLEAAQREHEHVIQMLLLNQFPIIAGSYSDLLEQEAPSEEGDLAE